MPKVLIAASTHSHLRTFHLPYFQAFHDLGWQVHAACGGTPCPLPEADRIISLPFEKKMTAPANFRAQAQLRQLMQAEQYDLVCVHTSLAAFFVRRAAAGVHPRPRLVNMVHGYLYDDDTPAAKRLILRTAELLTAPQTDLLLTMNQWDLQEAQRHRLGRRIASVPGIGVDASRFHAPDAADREAFRIRHDITDRDILLVYAAEFSKRKRHSVLIRALAQLPPHVKLALPGQGDLLEECRSLAESLQIADRVLFPGYVTDMAAWYGAADAAVTSARSEGLPFNVMEALFSGLPVIASAVKGHTDLITHEYNGLLYPFGDVDACAAQLLRLIDEPELAASMKRVASLSVEPYALETVLPQVMDQYLSLVPAGVR